MPKDVTPIIYTTPTCAFCNTEKQWMTALGVDYVAKDIENDDEAKQELLNKLGGNFTGVPVTDVAGELIVGFDRPKLQQAFVAHKLVKS